MRLIDVDEVKKSIVPINEEDATVPITVADAKRLIFLVLDTASTVKNYKEEIQASLIYSGKIDAKSNKFTFTCTHCNREINSEDSYHSPIKPPEISFCPYCGAKLIFHNNKKK